MSYQLRARLEGGPFDGQEGEIERAVDELWVVECPESFRRCVTTGLAGLGRLCPGFHWWDDGEQAEIDAEGSGRPPTRYRFEREHRGTRVYVFGQIIDRAIGAETSAQEPVAA